MWQEAQGEDDRRSLTEVTHWVLANSFPANVTANFHSKFMGFWLDKDVAEVNSSIHRSMNCPAGLFVQVVLKVWRSGSGMDLYPLDFGAAGLLGNLKYLKLEDWANQKKQKTAV
ncbi:hypothetical protein CK203_061111 [Vitis vinifera]|uniref:Uncharacterized protein n=1 Tax=Vitis vinifera TaxID=29760 RepID=A0A438GHZ9_VITVI|nr:hypothetical protein CK203_061111 [Vitis vinifera]